MEMIQLGKLLRCDLVSQAGVIFSYLARQIAGLEDKNNQRGDEIRELRGKYRQELTASIELLDSCRHRLEDLETPQEQ
jgi:hypothetical protein